ncbi:MULTISPECIES: hypothetical protein [unclassified Mesorhizobium]|uniref:hypothetical protein n=1 Tax=unclassified Mesorhizobium TaxID=325217 RepID=UPI0010932339|nr:MULTISPECIES: hypothetical protein [unclassified Mesorhizobium]TGQ45470.1 hypothetical protein EN857_01950 [Mesorhizobium sp. M4B.F.Ca.ET.214.01.1.1]TGQ63099.1 hypothetical protein EN854_01950 [Mesorhizobium sp. M4B.F.Ca.ET.211.01.1.1]TGU40737.1 hypothetical protein EN793_01950 [Mesorhizobium sp. M4B.F.Ca.ET.150.01.1.1]
MSDSILAAAEAEEADLLMVLETNPTFQRLLTVRQVIALLNGSRKEGEDKRPVRFPPRVRERLSKRDEVEHAVWSHLKDTGRRASSGELFAVIKRAGIIIGGAVPSKALASTLSTSARFNNIRELGGYGLEEWGDTAGPSVEMKNVTDDKSVTSSQITGEPASSPFETKDQNNGSW